ncbi:MAG TPA: choice-of-anchor Q domain-containing protein, partial [Chthoniobacterales bacterium]|nr:choice-of-anchor Q domain-containing protein [Chthoniobacterales bacterium]
LTITNTTISGNSAGAGGGLHVSSGKSRNTIVASNTSADGPDVKGALASEGFNLVGNNSGATISNAQPSDQIGTAASPIDPLLGPLQDNGGPTFTHALLAGSPAIDKGESSGSTTDQRGFGRPVDIPEIANAPGGDGADIGAFESTRATLANISTRSHVQPGDNAMIGGFIITGTEPRTVIVRGLGPSINVPGSLADPVIEVHGSSGELLATNDNWQEAATRQEIIDSGLAPVNDLEPALWGILNPGAYTVVVRGKNNLTGISLFEVYDLDRTAVSKLANISSRGLVGTGDDVMIGGTIIDGNTSGGVLFRALGPSLTNFGIANGLGDPILELYDGNGGLIAVNHDWRDDQEAEISNTGLAPSNDLESAIVRDLTPGPYTAIVRGKDNGPGIAVVEVYNLN